MSFDQALVAIRENRPKNAAHVLAGLVDIADRKGGMSGSQKDFVTICRRMLREDHPLQSRIQAWLDARTRA